MHEPTPIARQFGIKAVDEEQKQELLDALNFVTEFLNVAGCHEATDEVKRAVEYAWEVLYGQSLHPDEDDDDDD
jgi:hypothetical protein